MKASFTQKVRFQSGSSHLQYSGVGKFTGGLLIDGGVVLMAGLKGSLVELGATGGNSPLAEKKATYLLKFE